MIAIRLNDGTIFRSERHHTHVEFLRYLMARNPRLTSDEFLGSVFGRINEDGEFVVAEELPMSSFATAARIASERYMTLEVRP